MRHYEHNETGWVLIGAMLGGIALFALMAFLPGGVPRPVLILVPSVLAAALLLTFRMRTYADETGVGFSMGIGLVKRYFRYDEIESATILKMGFLAGWGIHYAGGGWLYNVNSQMAVEVRLKDGRRCFIGTDDAPGLLAAVQPRLRG